MNTQLTISNFNQFLKKTENNEALTVTLSGLANQTSKPDLKKEIFKLFKSFIPMIKVKNSMNDSDIMALVNLFYKNYYWMKVSDVYNFFEWVLAGNTGELYQTFDIPTFMQLVAKFQATFEWEQNQRSKVFDDTIETLQLTSGEEIEPDFGGLAEKLDMKFQRRKVRLRLAEPKYLNLEGFCNYHGLQYDLMYEYFAKIYGPQFDNELMSNQAKAQNMTIDTQAEKFRRGFINTQIRAWLKDMKEFEKKLITHPQLFGDHFYNVQKERTQKPESWKTTIQENLLTKPKES